MVRARILSTLVASLLIAATGCAAAPAPPVPAAPAKSTPAPAPTPTPTPTADPLDDVVSTVVITATGLSMRTSDGRESGFFVYEAGPAAAIDELSRILDVGPDIVYNSGDDLCASESTTYDWGVVSLSVIGDGEESDKFWVVVDDSEPMAGASADVLLTTEHGGRVGGSAAELLSKIPTTQAEHWDYEGQRWDLFMDGVDGLATGGVEDEVLTGVRLQAIDDVINTIHAPVVLDNDC